MPCYRAVADGVVVAVRLTPKAARDSLDGVGRLADGSEVAMARVRALPAKGAANDALVALLAKALKIPRQSVNDRRWRRRAPQTGPDRRGGRFALGEDRTMAKTLLNVLAVVLSSLLVAGRRSSSPLRAPIGRAPWFVSGQNQSAYHGVAPQ